MSPTEVIAGEVRAHMARTRTGQAEIAGVLHRTQSWVSRRTNGLMPFTIDELFAVSGVLGVPVRELMGNLLDDQVAS